MAPYIIFVVHHAARICSVAIGGDEHGSARIPAGWEILKPTVSTQNKTREELLRQACPRGYKTYLPTGSEGAVSWDELNLLVGSPAFLVHPRAKLFVVVVGEDSPAKAEALSAGWKIFRPLDLLGSDEKFHAWALLPRSEQIARLCPAGYQSLVSNGHAGFAGWEGLRDFAVPAPIELGGWVVAAVVLALALLIAFRLRRGH